MKERTTTRKMYCPDFETILRRYNAIRQYSSLQDKMPHKSRDNACLSGDNQSQDIDDHGRTLWVVIWFISARYG
jgi:hypothetical protein